MKTPSPAKLIFDNLSAKASSGPPRKETEFDAWLTQSLGSASGLGELADVAHHALGLEERRARGESEKECAEAWILWAGVEWTLAASKEDANVDLAPGSMDIRADWALPLSFLEQWQMRAASGLIEALARPSARGSRAEARAFCDQLTKELAIWAQALPSANDAELVGAIANPAAQARRLSRVAEELARRLTGSAFWTLAHAAEPLWSSEKPFSAFLRQQTIRFREEDKGIRVFGAPKDKTGAPPRPTESFWKKSARALLSDLGCVGFRRIRSEAPAERAKNWNAAKQASRR